MLHAHKNNTTRGCSPGAVTTFLEPDPRQSSPVNALRAAHARYFRSGGTAMRISACSIASMARRWAATLG